MINVLMTNNTASVQRFYRVEVSYNLFGEYVVMREWGFAGAKGRQALSWFANLRDACVAADRWQKHAGRRGYKLEGESQ